MRKLASIKEITDISPIEGADLIVLATVNKGWSCVVKKDEFKVGDLGVYFEIDSFLPEIPEFEFLRKSCFKKMGDKNGFRLKTIRLKGTLSQGLLIPLSAVKSLIDGKNVDLSLDADLTDVLGVEKYESEIPAILSGELVGDFPYFIPKTDEERIQNVFANYSKEFNDNNDKVIEEMMKDENRFQNEIKKLRENRVLNPIRDFDFEATIKLDGTSMTCFVVDPSKFQTKNIVKKYLDMKSEDIVNEVYFGVCGRNYEIRENDDNTYWKVANRDIKDKLIDFYNKTKRSIAIQGELMGEGIQKNREKLKGHNFYCYKVFDIDNQRFLDTDERNEFLDDLGINKVPFIENIKVFKVFKTLDEILKYAEGFSINNPIREGVVFKSNQLYKGNPITFKAISNLFLLKGGE